MVVAIVVVLAIVMCIYWYSTSPKGGGALRQKNLEQLDVKKANREKAILESRGKGTAPPAQQEVAPPGQQGK